MDLARRYNNKDVLAIIQDHEKNKKLEAARKKKMK